MKRLVVSLAASACLVALLGAAEATVVLDFATFVAGSGSDANDCLTPTTPCRQIGGVSGALSKTLTGGRIHVAAGNYDSFAVNSQSVDIIAEQGTATVNGFTSIPGGGQAAIVINGNNIVRIRGLWVNPVSNGSIGFVGAGTLYVEDCLLTNNNGEWGIDFRPNSAAQLYITNSSSEGNGGSGGGGIRIRPTGSDSAKVMLDNSRVESNSGGVLVDGSATSGDNAVTIRNSVMSGNTTFGLRVVESGAGSSNVSLESSTTNSNGTNGVAVSGANGIVRMRNSTSNNNAAAGLVVASGGQIISHGGNVVAGNGTNGLFTNTVAQQ